MEEEVEFAEAGIIYFIFCILRFCNLYFSFLFDENKEEDVGEAVQKLEPGILYFVFCI